MDEFLTAIHTGLTVCHDKSGELGTLLLGGVYEAGSAYDVFGGVESCLELTAVQVSWIEVSKVGLDRLGQRLEPGIELAMKLNID